ncbi:MAG TPA: hemolysin III family protein [Planctomycetota bacterium]|nr:hemolysin III family protein [Planctomycetota bacterium]
MPALLALDGWDGDLTPLFGLREPVSGLTHLVGALISLAGGVVLWRRSAGDRAKQVSMAIYAAGLVLLYTASAAYHLVTAPPEVLANYRRADHAAIFLLIAGTYTPFCVNAASGLWRLGGLLTIWTTALAGIALKVTWIDMPDAPSAGLYIAMGWLVVLAYRRLAATISHRAMALAGLGGALYTLGASLDVLEWPVPFPGYFGFHETFHVLVMLASAVHFYVVLRYVVPVERPEFGRAPAPAAAAVTGP